MKSKFKRCDACNLYTLKEVCPACGGDVRNPVPPRFSLEDKYGVYRRRMKKERINDGRG
ncbi:MAG: RNA-protein complex protein Nop10 [Halobacteriota archaeon]|nr:RNA-protein complex protein Nop10 [Halobacteriota archaeon]